MGHFMARAGGGLHCTGQKSVRQCLAERGLGAGVFLHICRRNPQHYFCFTLHFPDEESETH